MPSDQELLVDMIVAARRVESFMADRQRDDLADDYQLQFAVRKGIEIIGEAAGGLSETIKAEFPDRALAQHRRHASPPCT